ncbi:putative nucleosome assembly protein I [Filobasidium floriforme]|uniref:putative nucleosome assembly protein I n=1 Tax=Filobasidium floriforme TaxID=5210 RepID=UPI001E8D7515|nr:putative nucleosome assembly protein I [Filobasidium floriforme]KAH8082255.1 putative nucleosome assembly protein I [Filobasidium floriforme]
MAQNIEPRKNSHIEEAATPMNTPLNAAPISGRDGLPQPTVATIGEDEEDEAQGGNPASVLARNPALLNMMQDRLGSLVGKPSGYLKSLPPAVKRRVEGLKGIQTEHSKIESEFQREILEIEKKYAARYAPLYTRRKEIIAGKTEPTEDEVTAGEAVSDVSDSEDEDDEARVEEVDESGDKADIKGIPEFWLTALKNHQVIGEMITEKDEEAIRHLVDIRLEYLDVQHPGFKLLFEFESNEFFEDSVLEKTYYYQEEVGYGGDFVYDKAVGHEIKWKEDKDLTKKIEIKKQRNKNTNRTRVIKKVVPVDSFFNFFKPPQPPSMEAMEEGNVDEDELEDLDEKLEIDYQLGEDLKERIIPRAIDYFTGKALEYDDNMEELDDDEFDDEDFDDDEDDEQELRQAHAGGQQDAQECKQQ